MLLDGEVVLQVEDERGRMHEKVAEGRSAYETRTAAYDGITAPESIIEVAQLERTVRQIRDREVRAMMALRIRTGESEWLIEEELRWRGWRRTTRSPLGLVERGVELVRRIERGHHSQLTRVRAALGQDDSPVCWRCLATPVDKIGTDCGETCPALKEKRRGSPPRKHDYTNRAPVADLTAEQRDAEIAELARTQDEGPIPGGAYYDKIVVPYGTHPPEYGRQWDITQRPYRR